MTVPAPLTPPECDLRDFPFMPLEIGRLLSSETWLTSTGDEKSAAMTLWLQSWHQVPAGSLPDNDRMLAILSQAGGIWRRVKAAALRGWIKCSDGRFYHPVVCEKALDSWARKLAQRERTRRASRGRWRPSTESITESVTESITESVTESITESKGEGERQGRENKKTTLEGGGGGGSAEGGKKTPSLRSGAPPPQEIFIENADQNKKLADESEAVAAFNRVAERLRWPMCLAVSAERRRKLSERIAEAGGVDGWVAALERASNSPFLRGETQQSGYRDWRPSLDFFLEAKTFLHLIEGQYDARKRPENGMDRLIAQLQRDKEAAENGSTV